MNTLQLFVTFVGRIYSVFKRLLAQKKQALFYSEI